MERANVEEHKTRRIGRSLSMSFARSMFRPKTKPTVKDEPPEVTIEETEPSISVVEPLSSVCGHCKKSRRPAAIHCKTCDLLLCLVHSEDHQAEHGDHCLVSMSARLPHCWKHAEDFQFYCKTCQCCLCSCCATDHLGHFFTSLNDALAEMTSAIGSQLSSVESSCSAMSTSVSRLTELGNDLTKKEMDVAKRVNESFGVIQMALDNRRNELISSLSSKRLQVEAHKHSIQSLLTRVTEKTQSCRNQLQSSDVIQILSASKSMCHLLSSADVEIKSIELRDEYDSHLEFSSDESEVIRMIRHTGRVNDDFIKMKVMNACRRLIKADHDLKELLECVCHDIEEDLSDSHWLGIESKLNETLSCYYSRLTQGDDDMTGEWFDDMIQPFELEWNEYAKMKRGELRKKWEDLVSSEFDAVCHTQSSQTIKKLDVASVESFEQSWDLARQEMVNGLNDISIKYGSADEHVKGLKAIRTGQVIEKLTKYFHSYHSISSTLDETKQDVTIAMADMRTNMDNLKWDVIESSMSAMMNGCKSQLSSMISGMDMDEGWNDVLIRQFQPVLDDWFSGQRNDLKTQWDEEVSWRTRPCQTELDCRRAMIAILKQMRGESNWNGPDNKGKQLCWWEDSSMNEWRCRDDNEELRVDLSVSHFLKSLRLSSLSLSGSLCPDIGKLISLQFIDLSRNELTSLPSEISFLSNLIYFNVSFNKLAAFPVEVTKLDSLTSLYISNNCINSLPSKIVKMVNLKELDISFNSISGSAISLLTILVRSGNLDVLNLHGNLFSAQDLMLADFQRLTEKS